MTEDKKGYVISAIIALAFIIIFMVLLPLFLFIFAWYDANFLKRLNDAPEFIGLIEHVLTLSVILIVLVTVIIVLWSLFNHRGSFKARAKVGGDGFEFSVENSKKKDEEQSSQRPRGAEDLKKSTGD